MSKLLVFSLSCIFLACVVAESSYRSNYIGGFGSENPEAPRRPRIVRRVYSRARSFGTRLSGKKKTLEEDNFDPPTPTDTFDVPPAIPIQQPTYTIRQDNYQPTQRSHHRHVPPQSYKSDPQLETAPSQAQYQAKTPESTTDDYQSKKGRGHRQPIATKRKYNPNDSQENYQYRSTSSQDNYDSSDDQIDDPDTFDEEEPETVPDSYPQNTQPDKYQPPLSSSNNYPSSNFQAVTPLTGDSSSTNQPSYQQNSQELINYQQNNPQNNNYQQNNYQQLPQNNYQQVSQADNQQSLPLQTNNQQGLPQQPNFQQGLPQQSNFQQSLSQQSNFQQGLPQQSNFQQDLPQQSNFQQGLPQQTNSQQGLPQQTNNQQTNNQQTNNPQGVNYQQIALGNYQQNNYQQNSPQANNYQQNTQTTNNNQQNIPLGNAYQQNSQNIYQPTSNQYQQQTQSPQVQYQALALQNAYQTATPSYQPQNDPESHKTSASQRSYAQPSANLLPQGNLAQQGVNFGTAQNMNYGGQQQVQNTNFGQQQVQNNGGNVQQQPLSILGATTLGIGQRASAIGELGSALTTSLTQTRHGLVKSLEGLKSLAVAGINMRTGIANVLRVIPVKFLNIVGTASAVTGELVKAGQTAAVGIAQGLGHGLQTARVGMDAIQQDSPQVTQQNQQVGPTAQANAQTLQQLQTAQTTQQLQTAQLQQLQMAQGPQQLQMTQGQQQLQMAQGQQQLQMAQGQQQLQQ